MRAHRFIVFFLAALLQAAAAHAQAPAAPATLAPGDNLVVQGIPAIPASLADKVRRYTETRTAVFQGWHPRDREMLVTTRFADTAQVHRVRMPEGARTQLTFHTERVGRARMQPVHGRYFVFSKDVGGGEWFQLYRQDWPNGEPVLLTDGKSRNTDMVWDHQGQRIAYASTRRTGRDSDLWVMDPAQPSSDRLVLQLEGGGWSPEAWSPDGRTLLLKEFRSIGDSRLWLVDVAAGTKRQVLPAAGQKDVAFGDALFTGDGRGLYVASDADAEFRRLLQVDLATGATRVLTPGIDWDVDDMALSLDGRRLAFTVNEAGRSRLYLLDTGNPVPRSLGNLPVGVFGGLQWHANGRDIGFSMLSARTPTDAYSIDADTGTLTRWTASETGGVDTSSFADAQPIAWKSFDGRTIAGFLYLPPAKFTGPRPVIVDIHGGPEGQSRPRFLGLQNYLVQELGIAVIYPNVRGSTGHGKTFATLDNGFLREDSYKDIGALFDWIAQDRRFDAKRVLVQGGSYGGHMALAIATNYNDRICCTIDVVGMSNLVTFLENTEAYRRDLRRVEYGDERDPKMREFLTRIAPITRAAHITKPLFVVQGRNDPRVPWTEATQMVETARKSGAPVWFLMANDEGHGFAKKKNRDFQFYSSLLFIEQYLLK